MSELVPADDAPATSMMNFIAQALRDPSIEVSKLEALLRMQREVRADQARELFTQALQAAQSEVPQIEKNGTVDLGGGKGSYKFATEEDQDKVLRPIMDRHGFTLMFDVQERQGGGPIVIGTLRHAAGHAEKASMPLALDSGPGRNNLQAMGSSLSYGRRYIREMFFNVVRKSADDDGVSGGKLYISGEQCREFEELIKGTGRDRRRFLDVYGLRDVTEIEVGQYTILKNVLLQAQRKPTKPS